MKGYRTNILGPLVTFLCGGGAAVAFLILYYSSNALMQSCVKQIISSANDSSLQSHNQFNLTRLVEKPVKQTDVDQELIELLQKAAMDDKTVLMTEINGAWSEPNSLFDMFLESFHIGIQIEHFLNHMIVAATDEKAFAKCKSVHLHCYRFITEGVDFSGEQVYNTKDYLKMMWARNKFQGTIVEMGYNLLFTDTDIMWFRNPLQHITVEAQMTVACDKYRGYPDDFRTNDVNMGFMYTKSTSRTIAFYKDWYAAKVNYTKLHEQAVFQKIGPALSAKHQVTIRFLDTSYVGGLCQPKIDFTKLCTFHATCRIGLVKKEQAVRKILNQWKDFKEHNLTRA